MVADLMCVVALRIDSDMLCPGLPTRDFGCRLPPRPPRLRSHSHTKTGVRLRCTPTRSPISARRALLMSTSRAHIPHGSGVPTWHMHSRDRTGLRRRPGRQTNSVLSLSLSLSLPPLECLSLAAHRIESCSCHLRANNSCRIVQSQQGVKAAEERLPARVRVEP